MIWYLNENLHKKIYKFILLTLDRYTKSTEINTVHAGSFGGIIFPNLALRIYPISICLAFEASSLLI